MEPGRRTLVLGADPGITACGLALVELGAGSSPRLVVTKRIATKASEPLGARLGVIWRVASELVIAHHPLVIAIEEQSGAQVGAFHRGDFNVDNSKTMIVVGLLVGCAHAYGIPVVWVRPQQAKLAVTGKGGRSADKAQIKRAVAAICGVEVGVLTEAGADAAAIAIAGAREHRRAAA